MRESLVVNEPMSEEKISEEAVREELSRILESSMFIQSDRLGRFLRFTVETTLAGDAEMLKEYLIGTEVYDRKPPYHPNMDSIVRSEARRLRNKLKEYYESVGKEDPVFIYYRLGSYAPVFRPHHSHDGSDNVKDARRSEHFIEGRNADGFLIWSERFETKPDTQSLFKVSERIASALISRVRPEKSSIQKQKVKKASYQPLSEEKSGADRIALSSRR